MDDIVHSVNLRLNNMIGGFPFEYAGMVWKDSERLYLCGEFSLNEDNHKKIQNFILTAKSGYAAKDFYKIPSDVIIVVNTTTENGGSAEFRGYRNK